MILSVASVGTVLPLVSQSASGKQRAITSKGQERLYVLEKSAVRAVMGRGQMSGGGSSQLSYLFGDSSSEQTPVTTTINQGGRAKVGPASFQDKVPVGDAHLKNPPVESVKDAAISTSPDSTSLQTLGGGSTPSKTSVNNYHRAGGKPKDLARFWMLPKMHEFLSVENGGF